MSCRRFPTPMSKSLLWTRHDLDGTVKHLQDDPSLKNFTKEILVQQTRTYNNLYKPTFVYPHAKFWGEANEPIFNWLYELKRIQRPLKAADFEKSVDAQLHGQDVCQARLEGAQDAALHPRRLERLAG